MPISFDQACHHHKEHTKLTHWRAHIIGKNSEIKGRCFFQFFRTLSNFLFQFIPPPFFFQNIALLERESYQKEREIRWNNRGSCKEIRQVSKRLPYLQSWPYVSNTSMTTHRCPKTQANYGTQSALPWRFEFCEAELLEFTGRWWQISN